jgi:hypothetical protein
MLLCSTSSRCLAGFIGDSGRVEFRATRLRASVRTRPKITTRELLAA